MSKTEKRFDTSEFQFNTFDNALFGTLFAMSKVFPFSKFTSTVPFYYFFVP